MYWYADPLAWLMMVAVPDRWFHFSWLIPSTSTTQHASMPAPFGVVFGKPLDGVFGYGVTCSVPSPVSTSNQNG